MAATLAGPACQAPLDAELNGRRLTLEEGGRAIPVFDRARRPVIRVAGPGGPVEVRLEGGTTLPVRLRRAEGAIYAYVDSASVALGRHALIVSREGRERSFDVRFAAAPADMPEIRPIVAARTAGDFDGAMALAEAARSSESRLVRINAAIERGRIALRRGRPLDAARLWQESAEIARAAGSPTEAVERLLSAAFAARAARRFAMTEALLDRAATAIAQGGDLFSEHFLATERGELANDLGDPRRALAALDEALRIARRLGVDDALYNVEMSRANCLAGLGRFAEALETFPDPNDFPQLDASDRARVDTNVAWIEIRAIRGGVLDIDLSDPRARLERAIERLRRLNEPWRLANALCTLARGELLAGDVARADALVRSAKEAHPRIFAQQVHDCSFVEIEIRLARGDVDAAENLLAALEPRLRQAVLIDETAITPATLRARIARARGRPEAVDLYLEAFRQVVEMARHTPIQGDRSSYISGRTELVDELIDLMATKGDLEGAFSIADADQALLLTDLDAEVHMTRLAPQARREWAERLDRYNALREQLPKAQAECDRRPSVEVPACQARVEALRSRISAAIDRAFAVIDRDQPATAPRVSLEDVTRALGAHGALLLVHGVKAQMRSFWIDRRGIRLERGSPPVDRWLEDAGAVERLNVVGRYDPIGAEGGDRIAARVAVVMVPSARFLFAARPLPSGNPLVVGDPNGDLPGAAREAHDVDRRALVLVGSAASRTAILKALDGAVLFHFAGHARIVGKSPWDTELRTADGVLTLEDLLAARPRTGLVVLSACQSSGDAARGGIGLPQAFLLAGARAVLATTRPLSDADDSDFVSRFYAAGGRTHPAEAFRIAIRASQAAGDRSWEAFRLFGR